jgi:hypothetical protein
MVEGIFVNNVIFEIHIWHFLFPKINFQKNWIRIYERLQDKIYMQNVILSLLHDCIHNMNE